MEHLTKLMREGYWVMFHKIKKKQNKINITPTWSINLNSWTSS